MPAPQRDVIPDECYAILDNGPLAGVVLEVTCMDLRLQVWHPEGGTHWYHRVGWGTSGKSHRIARFAHVPTEVYG